MKLGPATKLDKRNKKISPIFQDSVMSKDFDVIAIFPTYGLFGAIRKPDSGRIVCKTYLIVAFLTYKNQKQK